jgi:hypothetical protein
MHNQSQFLNYWNCNQTFYLEGQADRHYLHLLLNTVKSINPSIKIQDFIAVKLMTKEAVVEVGKSLNSRAHKFQLKLDELRLPLKYAVMSLLSLNRVTIYNETLVAFINSLATDPKWNSEKYAEYGGYLIDQMAYDLNPKKQSELTDAFKKQLEKQENAQNFS